MNTPTPADHPPHDGSVGASPPAMTPWFGAIGLLLLITLLAGGFVQARQYALLNQTVQYQDDYLVLSLFQLETEYLRLRHQLQVDLDEPTSQALKLRYDIFQSRVDLLQGERPQRLMADMPAAALVMRELAIFASHADLYLGDAAGANLSPQAARALAARELESLGEPIHELMLDATHRVALQITERQDTVRQHNKIGLALTGFLSFMVLAFALLALRQMRMLAARHRRQEALADQLRQARIEAEVANEAKSRFLTDMSHELRTPLHGLLAMLSLARESPRHPQAGPWLATADESAQHLLRLLDDLLDLSRLEAGSVVLAPQPLHLGNLLTEARALMLPVASAKGLTLVADLDPSLPDWVLLDPTRVRQVLFNLLGNAVKFSDSGAVMLRCRKLPDSIGPAQLQFEVADTGRGIDANTLAGLFRRDSGVQPPPGVPRPGGGMGLGLAISHKLARLMGGDLLVHSHTGVGSVFSLRCPFMPTDAPAEAPCAQAPTSTRALQVLVADDHPVNRLVLQALLQRLGHQARLVNNGAEAVQALREQAFDLALIDVHMPVLDGVGATAAIRALPAPASQTCLVALTADVFDDARRRCLAAGIDEVLTKPLGLASLQDLLGRRFGRQQARTAAAVATVGLTPGGPGANAQMADNLADKHPGNTSASATASAARPDKAALLDHALIGDVRGLIPRQQLPGLYASFFDDAAQASQRMRTALREADAESLQQTAHGIKGAALTLGLPALAEAAAALNRDADGLAAGPLALALHRFEDLLAATRQHCTGEGLLS